MESSAAKDLLPEVCALALAEAEKDAGACYRVIVFELTSAARPRPPCKIEWVDAREGARSRDQELRLWVLRRLPLDVRLLEAVSRHKSELSPAPGMDQEHGFTHGWLVDLALSNQALVPQEHRHLELTVTSGGAAGLNGLNLPDEAWDALLDPPLKPLPPPPPLATWIDEHRSKLPPQVR